MNILLSITAISIGVSDMQTNKTIVCSDRISEVRVIAHFTDELIPPAFLFFYSSLFLPATSNQALLHLLTGVLMALLVIFVLYTVRGKSKYTPGTCVTCFQAFYNLNKKKC